MILYLTYNDTPSGIYSSQVIDVVKFLRDELKKDIRLVAFISLRGFFLNRRKIKNEMQDAIVFPMIPGISHWRWNQLSVWMIFLLLKPRTIIGRSVLATHLALKFKKSNVRVVYDGRGAIAAEWKEYKVVQNKTLLDQIEELEKEAIFKSDFRIAVSHKLVEYWRHHYHYAGGSEVVIPCTLNRFYENLEINTDVISKVRNELNFKVSDIVFVYSGSVAGWQSFELLYKALNPLLRNNVDTKILFLADRDENISQLEQEFPDRIISKKVTPKEVPFYLLAGDYGLLIREQTITNYVASPVKFAEYLACGLPVIISENLGDYSEYVGDKKSSFLVNDFVCLPSSLENKKELRLLHLKKFRKSTFIDQYKKVITDF